MKSSPNLFRCCLLAATASVILLASGCGPKKAEAAKSEKQALSDPLKIEVSASLRDQIKVGQPQWQEVAKTLDVCRTYRGGRHSSSSSRFSCSWPNHRSAGI